MTDDAASPTEDERRVFDQSLELAKDLTREIVRRNVSTAVASTAVGILSGRVLGAAAINDEAIEDWANCVLAEAREIRDTLNKLASLKS